MKKLLLTIVSSLLLLPGAVFADEKPNVVLMMADNLGFGDLTAYNLGTRGGIQTPRIDSIAHDGLQLTQFLVEPGCTPTRTGLMTGQYSIRNGMSLIIAPGGDGGLNETDYTLGKLFKDAGYNTAYSGKWHLGPSAQSQPQNQGFDHWLIGFKGTTDQVEYTKSLRNADVSPAMMDAATPRLLKADGPGEPEVIGIYDMEARLEIEERITDESIKYIKQNARKKEPFFLMVGFTRPHFPNKVSEEFEGISGAGDYGDSIMELDYRTGQILDAIDKAGITDNTIVVWISDNGATVTGTTLAEIHQGDNGPFRGELGDANEGSIRTAGMIKWPGKIPSRRSNEMLSVHDFLPTFANIVGVELPNDRPYDGVDQTDFLLGNQEQSNRNSLITFIGDRIAAVRWNEFRIYPLLITETPNNPNVGGYVGMMSETAGFPQAFNIEADPKERVDILTSGAGWLMIPYMQEIGKYRATLEKYPNPPAPSVNKF